MKTPLGDMELRLRNGTLKLGKAAKWLEEEVFGIDPGSIAFFRADGQRAKPSDTIGSLRSTIEVAKRANG